eukprot:s689_g31.t1
MRLNRNAAKLMCRFGANGATDITGFGLLGHANNLAAVQKAEVSIEIRKMPIIRGLLALESCVDANYQLSKGFSAETSGGLLVALPSLPSAQDFVAALQSPEFDGPEAEAWIVGEVVAGDRTARLAETCQVMAKFKTHNAPAQAQHGGLSDSTTVQCSSQQDKESCALAPKCPRDNAASTSQHSVAGATRPVDAPYTADETYGVHSGLAAPEHRRNSHRVEASLQALPPQKKLRPLLCDLEEQFKKHAGADQALDQKELAEIWIKAAEVKVGSTGAVGVAVM